MCSFQGTLVLRVFALLTDKQSFTDKSETTV